MPSSALQVVSDIQKTDSDLHQGTLHYCLHFTDWYLTGSKDERILDGGTPLAAFSAAPSYFRSKVRYTIENPTLLSYRDRFISP